MKKILSNFHTHTERCRHATGSDEEYVLAAIDYGYKVLGFSDHQEISLDDFYPNNNGKECLDNYIRSISYLREKYKDKIEIHIGLESLYFPGMKKDLKNLNKLGIEYLILGQHDLLDENGVRHYLFYKKIDEKRVKEYINYAIRGIKTGLYSYMAHPDLFILGVEEFTDNMRKDCARLCKAAKQYNVPLEINLSGLNKNGKIKFPSDEFFKIAGEIGNDVIFGADAHNPDTFKNTNYKYGLELVRKYKLNLINKIDLNRLK